MGTPNRVDQVNGEILRILSELLPTIKDPRVNGLVSIVRVDTAGDYSQCRVYVSTMGDAKALLKGLQSAAGYLRRGLGQSLSLRHTPALSFIPDDSIRQGAHILDVLNHLEDID